MVRRLTIDTTRHAARRPCPLLIPLFAIGALVVAFGTHAAVAQDPQPPAIDPAGLAPWVPAAGIEPVRWRDDQAGGGLADIGPPRVAWLIGCNELANDGWLLPGAGPTQERLARCCRGLLRADPVITQRGREAEAWRLRDTLRGLAARFTRPDGVLLIWLQARAWRDADGRLMLAHRGTQAAPQGSEARYDNALPLATLAAWLREFTDKLEANAPHVALVLELYRDPLRVGVQSGNAAADDQNPDVAMLTRLELAGPQAVCAENVRADASAPASLFAAAVEQALTTDAEITLAAALAAMRDGLAAHGLQPRLTAAAAGGGVLLRPQSVAMRVHVVSALDESGAATRDASDVADVAGATGATVHVESAGAARPAPATFEALPSGRVRLRASAPGFVPLVVDVPLPVTRDRGQLELALIPAFALLDVQVQQPDGSPAIGVRVAVQCATARSTLIGVRGLHRRGGRTDAAGRVRLPVDGIALRGELLVVLDDGRQELRRVSLPALADADSLSAVRLRGGTIRVRSARIDLPAAVSPLAGTGLQFQRLGAFAWQQADLAEATLPLAEAGVAIAAWRSALALAQDDTTRAACRFRLRESALQWLDWCHRRVDAAGAATPLQLVRQASAAAAELVELFPGDAALAAELEFFEYAAMPPGLQRALTDAIALQRNGQLAAALPLLERLASDPRVPAATAARCRAMRDAVRDQLMQDTLARAQRLHVLGRWRDALAAADAACRLTPDLPLADTLRRQILAALAERNTTRDAALPLRPDTPLAADATRMGVSHESWLTTERWFELTLPHPASATIQCLRRTGRDGRDGDNSNGDDAQPAIDFQILPAGAGAAETVWRLAAGADATTRELQLPAGTSVIRVVRRDDPAGPANPAGPAPQVGVFLHIVADWSAATGESGESGESGQPPPTGTDTVPPVAEPGLTPDLPAPLQSNRPQLATVAFVQPQWYRLTAGAPATLTVNASFSHAAGDIDLALLDPLTMRELARATGREDREQLQWQALAGDYLLKVWNATPGSTNRVVLLVSLTAPAGSDPTSPAAPDAHALPLDQPLQRTLPAGQPYWLRVPISGVSHLQVAASCDPMRGEVAVALFAGNTDTLIASGRVTGSRGRAVTRVSRIVPAGVYLIRVVPQTLTGDAGEPPVDVDLLATAASLEGNTTPAAAVAIEPGLLDGLPIGSAPAWFVVDVPRPAGNDGDGAKRLLLIANPAGGNGSRAPDGAAGSLADIRIALFRDPTGEPLATSHGDGVLACDLPPADNNDSRVFIRLQADSRRVVTLDLTTAGPDPSLRARAILLEPALSPEAAPGAPDAPGPDRPDAGTPGELHPRQSRWYLLRVAEPTRLTVTCRFRHAEGDLDLRLWRDRRRVAWSETTNDDEALEADVAAGTCLLEVTHVGNPGSHPLPPTAYRLAISTSHPLQRPAVNHTSAATAAPLATDRIVRGTASGGAGNWYRLEIPDGVTRLLVSATFEPGAGLTLSLRKGDRVVAVGETLDDSASLAASIEADGRDGRDGQAGDAHYLVVSPSSDAPVDYQLAAVSNADDRIPLGAAMLADQPLPVEATRMHRLAVLRLSEVTLTCRFRNENGDVDLRLLRADGAELATSADVQNEETIRRLLQPGIYLVAVVYAGEDRGATQYSLTARQEPRASSEVQGGWSNVDAATALELESGEAQTGRTGGGFETWYRVRVVKPSHLSVRVQFTHDDGDIDIDLRSGADLSAAVTESNGEGDLEMVTATCDPGDWYIRVFSYDDGPANNFRIVAATQELGEGFTRLRALPLEPDADGTAVVEGEFTGLPRWYVLELSGDARVQARLKAAAGADARLTWHQAEPGPVAGGRGTATLTADVLPAGRWWLEIVRDGEDPTPYRLELSVRHYRDATSRDRAIPVGNGTFPEQTLQPGEVRWLSIDLLVPSRVLALLDSDRPLSAQLQSGTTTLQQATQAGATGVIHETLPAGRWFLRVSAPAPGGPARFRMVLDSRPVQEKPGSSRAAAIALKPGARLTGATDSSRSDWVMLVLTAPATVRFTVTFDTDLGDIDLRLWRGGELATQSDGTEDVEQIAMQLLPGVYFLELANIDGGTEPNQWRLQLDLTPDGRGDRAPDKEFR